VQHRTLLVVVAAGLSYVGRRAWAVGKVVGKIAAVLAAIAGSCLGGQWLVQHVVDSPRFRVRQINISSGAHVRREEVLALASVEEFDRLLLIDTDAVAARVASHPWVARVRVDRQLPSGLRIEVTERQAAAVAALSGLYLIDQDGHPFKRATMDEAEGLPVLTGIEREQYAGLREATEAAYREALGLLDEYYRRTGRPMLSEIAIDPRFGFTLYFLEGGAEVRIGRGNYSEKLARLDQILEAVSAGNMGGLAALRIVNLDAPGPGRVPVLLRQAEAAPASKTAPKLAKN
jgi:cell division protein FtsQ